MSKRFPRSLVVFILICSQIYPATSFAQFATPVPRSMPEQIPPLSLPAPATPVPLDEQVIQGDAKPNNERYVPLSPTPVGGITLPATQYAATYNFAGVGDITYSRIDVLVQNDAETKAVLKFAGKLSRKADRTMVIDFTADDAVGAAQHQHLISMMPLSLRKNSHEIPLSRHLVERIERKTYENFQSARDQYLTQNYSRFVRWGRTGEYKEWLSIARFSGNAVGTFLSVVGSGASMVGKLGYGVATGAMSAALMYYNNLYMGWLTHQRFADWLQFKTRKFWKWLGIPPQKVLEFGDETSAITKWNLIEVGFMAIQASLLKTMGTPMATTFGGYVAKGSMSLLLGFFAQYSWDKGNSELWNEYNRYVTDPNDRAFYETYSALKMVLVSWGQVTALSVALVYPRIGWPLLGIMAAMGFEFRRVANHTTPEELISQFTKSAFRY